MEEISNKIQQFTDLVSKMNDIKIEFGIFEEDGSKIEEISVYNLDGTVSKEKMQLSDILYLTEHGTITLPSRPILYNIYRQLGNEIPHVMEEVTDGIFNKDWGEKDIREKFQMLNWRINYIFIPNAITMVLASDNVISGLLGTEEETKYTYDLKKLKKFIKSKIFFTF